MTLRLILGMTCKSGNCLAGNAVTGIVAYAASNAVVLFDTLSTKQIGYLQESRQPISCISFSLDGTHILTGHLGYKPEVQVWSMAKRSKLAALQGHDCGIRCVAFSPNLDMIVSIGDKYDGFVYVWAWPQQQKIACNKFGEEIKAMAYDPLNRYFVTCGVHHIKFWYPEAVNEPSNENKPYSLALMKELSTLYRRPALLEHIKTATFISISFGSGKSADMVFAASMCGFVCRLSSGRTIEQVQRLDVTQLSSISVHEDFVFVGSVCGNIFLLDSFTMTLKTTLSFPIDVCLVKQANRAGRHWKEVEARERRGTFIYYDGDHKLLSAVSFKGTHCLWDLSETDGDSVGQCIKYYTNSHIRGISDSELFQYRESAGGPKKNCLLTASHDATIRLWGIKVGDNICCDHARTIYTELSCDQQTHSAANCGDSAEKNMITVVTSGGEFIATGNSFGRIQVHNVKSMRIVAASLPGHERGITCLSFCLSSESGYKYLFSGSRDRHINVYDGANQFCWLTTLNFHSGSLTAIGTKISECHILLVSTALDRSMVVSQSGGEKDTSYTVKFNRILSSSAVGFCFYKLEQELFIIVGTRTGEIHVVESATCAIVRSFRASKDPNCKLEKLILKSKEQILFTSCTDRSINVIDFRDGTVLSSIIGQASPTSGIHLFKQQSSFMSTSKDGCIFVWDIQQLVDEMKPVDKKPGLEINFGSVARDPGDWIEPKNQGVQFLHGSEISGPALIGSDSVSSIENKCSSAVLFDDSLENVSNLSSHLSPLIMKRKHSCRSDSCIRVPKSCKDLSTENLQKDITYSVRSV